MQLNGRMIALVAGLGAASVGTSGCGDDETGATGGAGGAGASGGSGGSFETCVPGTKYPCYSGPANTKNVGACTEGRATCNEQGDGLGPCEDEVLPSPETCLTPEDDDCDGPTNEEGEGCVCVPASSEPCYTGPAGTEDVGVCKGGTRTCDVSGTMMSGCIGEVGPTAEDCTTPADESCEGLAPDGCSGDYADLAVFGDAAEQTGRAIAFGADGSFAVAATCGGTVDFGGGALAPLGGQDVCVVKLAADGSHVWSQRYGDAVDQAPLGVAVAPNGDVIVVGAMGGTVDFGGGPLTSAGATDAFVLRLDATGGFVYASRFGDAGADAAAAVDVWGSGDIVVAGSFNDDIDLGGGPLTSAGGADAWVAVFDATGAHAHSKRFGDGSPDQYARAVAALSTGGYAVGVAFAGSLTFGGGNLASAGGTDIAYGVFTATGTYVRSERFGGALDQDITGIAGDAAGHLLLSGGFAGTVDFGLGTLTAAGGEDVYLVRLDDTGAALWAKRFGDGEAQSGVAVWAPSGDIVLTGTLVGQVDFGGGAVTAADADVFVARFDSAGAHQWSRIFGGAGEQTALAVDVAPSTEQVRIVGRLSGTPDFGGGPVASATDDLFVLGLVP